MTSRKNHWLLSLFVIPLVAHSFAPNPAFESSRSVSLGGQRSSSSSLLRSLPPPPGEAFIVFLGDDDREGDGEEEEDEEEDIELEVDQYTQAAQEEFRESGRSSASPSLATSSTNGSLTTKQDWGGALGKLRQRMEDIETGKSEDPSHALFRVMSAQTPNQLIGQFVTSANPQTVQAMSGAVSSLLGGRSMYADAIGTRIYRQER